MLSALALLCRAPASLSALGARVCGIVGGVGGSVGVSCSTGGFYSRPPEWQPVPRDRGFRPVLHRWWVSFSYPQVK